MNNPEKMKFETPNLTAESVAKIAQIFPGVVTEGKVNFDLLRTMLGDEVYGDEAYEFTWVGKRDAIAEAGRPIRKTLRPVVEDETTPTGADSTGEPYCSSGSKNWDTTENLYIEGDNLDVLKLLQESYLGKVKMIYIDPPYNTGNDFIYNDEFGIRNSEYEKLTGELDEETGERFFRNTETNGRFHSDWCSMMYPRLVLARNLLRDDGVIFISIDDNEVTQLRKISDEVFGECNFVGCFHWKKKSTSTNVANALVSPQTDYQVCYAKNISPVSLNRRETTTEQRSYPYSDELGNYRTAIIEKKESGEYARATMKFPILGILPRGGKRWQIGEKTAREYEKMNRFLVDNNIVKLKIYEQDDKSTFSANPTLILDCGSTDSAAKETNVGLLGQEELFSNPKPTELLLHLLRMGTSSDSIVLDFFSGSATTAHAVMQLNAEDGGNRKFIMVQLPEVCAEGTEAAKAGYKNICEIGKERIRRAGEKIKAELEMRNADEEMRNAECGMRNEKSAYNNSELRIHNSEFKSNSELRTPNSELDIGFRVLKLDDTNMNDVYYAPDNYTQELLFKTEDNIKSDRTDMDLLYGCLLDWGLPLSMPHTHEKIDGFTVHTYNNGDLIACFEKNISEKAIREIASRKPLRAVFRDEGFISSPQKINVFEIFKLLAPNTSVKVI
jgi:adenine-specific DNA-methyltransferase